MLSDENCAKSIDRRLQAFRSAKAHSQKNKQKSTKIVGFLLVF
jgi:hypothetical protein